MKKRYYKIGFYCPTRDGKEAIIERGGTEQGMVYKDERAFYRAKKKVCYIPELSDDLYTRQDFLNLCNGNEDMAKYIFYAVDWQSPETLIEEMFQNGEWEECRKCNYYYCPHEHKDKCPKCGEQIKSKKEEQKPMNATDFTVLLGEAAAMLDVVDGAVTYPKDTQNPTQFTVRLTTGEEYIVIVCKEQK